MITKLFDNDPMTGKREFWHYDETNDTATIETKFDVEDVVESNKASHNMFDGRRATWKGDMHKVASIPMPIYEDLRKKGWLPHQDQTAFKRWMNDPDNAVFRTRPGRV